MIIEKYLCPVGEEIDRDLDDLLAKQRIEPTTERSREIHKLIKLYFRHRKECFKCYVQIGVTNGQSVQTKKSQWVV